MAERLRRFRLFLVCFAAGFWCLGCVSSTSEQGHGSGLAMTPPRGWNSYNAFSWVLTEEEFLENARILSERLLKHGYEYAVVDWLWYRQITPQSHVKSVGFDVIDEWGRPIPDPDRWPSSRNGGGFRSVADKIHAMGLKFGIHIMHGIVAAAVERDTPIYGAKEGPGGRIWRASDIAVEQDQCRWMTNCFLGVNTSSEAGLAYITSLYQQFASWGVDLVKQDCVFGGPDLRLDEIAAAAEAIKAAKRPMLFSISPGKWVTAKEAKLVQNMSHTFRVSNDIWDKWSHLRQHFDIAREFSSLMGGPGLLGGKSWPDLDALPLGWLSQASRPSGPYRWCSLKHNEQRSLVTLWAIAKSPLMYGGDLRQLDDRMFELITHPLLLEINDFSFGNSEFVRPIEAGVTTAELDETRVWVARGRAGDVYVAFFNLWSFSSSFTTDLHAVMQHLNLGASSTSNWEVVDGWSGISLGVLSDTLTVILPSHSSAVYVLRSVLRSSNSVNSWGTAAKVMPRAVAVLALLLFMLLVFLAISSVRELVETGRAGQYCPHCSPPVSPGGGESHKLEETLLL